MRTMCINSDNTITYKDSTTPPIADFIQKAESERGAYLEKKPTGLFEVQKANDVIEKAKNKPDPVELYPPLILENELTILFADTGVGKTVLAFQMAKDIAMKGYTTIYLDLELSDKQFQRRYTNDETGEVLQLPNNLFRSTFSRNNKVPNETEYIKFFFDSLIRDIKDIGAKVVFIDNLTKLAAGSTDSSTDTIPILEQLDTLKREMNLTIIVLEHNKKVDTTRPIHLNDLQGSKHKSNFADAVFSIGRSNIDKDIRYIKQLKVRDGEEIYVTDNVLLCELSKANGYLSFTKIDFDTEIKHLKGISDSEKEEIEEKVMEMHNAKISFREIEKALNINYKRVERIIKKRKQ